jgi:transposase
MYLKKVKNKKSGKTKLYVAQSYRNSKGTPTCRNIEYIGFLEDLIEDNPNALEYYTSYAKSFENNVINMPVNLTNKNGTKASPVNIGYFFLESIYQNIGIDKFIKEYQKNMNFKYDLNEILRLLVFSRILKPASKLSTFNNKDVYFDSFKINLKDIYRSLSVMNDIKDRIQSIANKTIKKSISRDSTLVFYDVTNYYFETEIESDLKKKGMSKENKRSPIVQMGLLIDSNGLPIAYNLFAGNTHDSSTLIPFIDKMRGKYKFGKLILTADKGLNSGKNLAYLNSNKDGYIVSQKVRGASKELVRILLDEKDYIYNGSKTFKSKSFIRERTVKDENNETVELKEKVLCFWSKNYDSREKKKREKLNEKIQSFIDTPSKYKSSNKYGIKKYIKPHNVNKQTGEIQDGKIVLQFDKEKYDRDVELDGYYVIITNELELTNEEILEKYRGLWKIEESFKVIKTDLEGRPVYVRTTDHIEGHFLICFIALLITRILEYNLEHKYSIAKIIEALSKMTVSDRKQAIFEIANKSEIYKEIEKSFEVEKLLDFDYTNISNIKKYRREIKHYKIK